MKEDIVRVVRLVVYTGPRSWVEQVVARSVQGTKDFSEYTQDNVSIKQITATTLGLYPEIIEKAGQNKAP